MSDETKDTLERALAAHFADEFDGAVLSAWIFQAYGQHIETDNDYYLGGWQKGQPIHTSGGLLDYALRRHEARMAANLGDSGDE